MVSDRYGQFRLSSLLIMALQLTLCLAALTALSTAAFCPTYTCDSSLPVSTCASFTGSQAFKLNSNGCSTGYYCSAIALSEWAQLLYTSTVSPTSTYPCSVSSDTTASSSFTSLSCGTKLANKNFKNSKTIVSCTAHTDCVLVDSTYTTCMCVFKTDGSGICKAHNSNDDVYAGYWTDCGPSEVINDEDKVNYWNFYMTYWEYLQSTVECTNIFSEVTTLAELQSVYDGEGILTMGVICLLALY